MTNPKCHWEIDEVCTNYDCPCCADFCPAINYLDICRFFEPESMQTTNGCDSCNLYYYKEDPND